MLDREFLNVGLLRHADGPFIVSWNPGDGAVYGIGLRAPTARIDVAKLAVLAIATGEISEVKLMDSIDHSSLTDGKSKYLVWVPTEKEMESCSRVMERYEFYNAEVKG